MNKEELIAFEKDIEKLYSEGKIKAPIHLSGNNEDKLIELFRDEIRDDDWVFCSYRNHYHALLKGIPKEELKQRILKGNSMHISSRKHKFFSSSIVAGHLPIALGVALALKLKNRGFRVYAFCGDMAAETGVFHECTKYARRHNLPITFFVEDNGLAVYTPTKEVWNLKENQVQLSRDIPEDEMRLFFPQHQFFVQRYKYERKWAHHGIGLWIDFPEEKNPEPKYKENIKKAMETLAKDEKVIFIGQTTRYKGSLMYGTLEDIPDNRKIEFPIMEEVQLGMSIGLAMEGFIPISIFPRFDFLTLATNQLVNHLDKIKEITNGEFNPKVIVRTMIGSKTPLNPGVQHCQDHTEAYKLMLKNMNVIKLDKAEDIIPTYNSALKDNKPSLIVEVADLYK